MCNREIQQALAIQFRQSVPTLTPLHAAGSRRRRLWDLPHSSHCPVVGVCLPLETLRRLVGKASGSKVMTDDYEVHVGAVADCVSRNRLSELLQDELERRYAREVKAGRSVKTTKALADNWLMAVRQGDVAGTFWASLTHPCCDAILQEVLCRDMHMLQHQAGATVRVDLARFAALNEENGVLARELARAQERCTRALTEKTSELDRLQAQLMQLRADCLTKDSRLAFVSEDLQALKASLPDHAATQRLRKRLDLMTARQHELEGQNASLRQRLAEAEKSLQALNPSADPPAKDRDLTANTLPVSPITLHLQQKMVLCVGGRSGNIANYRDLVERVGGRFAHHDGGLEDSSCVLDASLAAADLVICQTGCISHNAYWKVKDFCKRTGKRCVYVENPSASSLARGLTLIADMDPENLSPASVGWIDAHPPG